MTLARLLSESIAGPSLPSTGDVLAIGVPFLRQLDRLHSSGMVMRPVISEGGVGLAGLDYDGQQLRFDPELVQRPTDNTPVVNRINPVERASGVEIAARLNVDHGGGWYQAVTSGDVFDAPEGAPERPSFLVGYRVWEQLHGHHDVLTDIALAGLVLTSYATGLDLDLGPAVHQLALEHKHLVQLNRGLHPVVAGVLSDMVRPDRHERPAELSSILARLEHHRDLPTDLDLAAAYTTDQRRTPGGWRTAVLSTLRERVFDLSRRNRQLYFRGSSTTLSLTEASVPLMLNVERIKPDDLLTWSGSSAEAFRKGRPVDLAKWCRFEEAPHIVPSLDKLISAERKFRAEHGQGRLQLIIAFLRWVDPETGETINSPLLSMPAQLVKKKGVQDRYTVEVDGEAEVNGSLAFLLRSRFNISLPERIDPDQASIQLLVDQLRAGIQTTDPSVDVDLVDKPRINLIKRRAQLRVDAYRRRRAQAQASSGRWRRQDHSYEVDDWRPLGLALYRRFVEPTELPLRSLSGAAPFLRRGSQFAASNKGARERENYAVLSGDVSRQRWEVDLCAVTLALLGSRRTTLARDYDALIAAAAATGPDAKPTMPDAPFNLLFSPEPPVGPAGPVAPISIDQPLVLPADDAQAQAVRRGVRGDSFIIQGPPGTGKSQTIANLIAALVAEDKRVLFVCEKRAALDVVAHRLKQVGLAELVATIHDSQLDRKAFIKDLGATYDDWLSAGPDDRQERRGEALAAVEARLRPIELAFEEIHRSGGGQGVATATGTESPSLVRLIERLVLLRSAGAGNGPASVVPSGLVAGDWLGARPDLDAVADELAAAGLSPRLGSHAAFRLHPSTFGSADPLSVVRSFAQSTAETQRALAAALEPSLELPAVPIRSIRSLVTHRDELVGLQRSGTLDALDRSSAVHAELRTADDHLRRWAAAAGHAAQAFGGWRTVPQPDDARNALAIAVSKENSTFKFLDRGWREVKRLVQDSYDFSRHQIDPSITQVLTELVAAFDAASGLESQRAYVRSRFATDDPSNLLAIAADIEADPWVTRVMRSVSDLPSMIDAATELVADAGHLLLDPAAATVADVAAVSQDLSQIGVAHERALVHWARLGSVPLPVLRAAVGGHGLDDIERSVIEGELHSVSGRLSGMTSAQLEAALEGLLDAYRALLAANADFVASRAERRFAENVSFAESSMAGRSDEDKARKKSYNAGRRVLEREFQKKIRHRSIRELASGDSGLVLRDLKPVWLMSPLSVSDTLPLDDGLFDVVIFDEASQVPVEDAVPTLHRGGQVVVVGDRMQLPPTRFFSAEAGDEDEDGIMIDADGHRLAITLDADSFLTQADVSLESALLSWHYRSRSESLIAYSNHAFYDGRLATIPDRRFAPAERPAITALSAEEAAANLVHTLDRPISFHMIEHGVYRDRRNEAEAEYIAELVRSLLQRQSEPGAERLTIGVVAFSEAQQGAIEDALAELGTLDPSFAALLEEEQLRTDDDEFVGLFVKNLENVQGDERDIIIMSVCYGPGPSGAMKMNFGPINQAGGERRLNVIFSRAKQHMAIVSSIEGRQITNTHNDGASNLARFLDYAAAESIGAGELSASLLDGLRRDRPPTSEPEAARSAVAVELATHLRERGWLVDLDVGRSVFTVDAAVRGVDGYVLGVLIDPAEGGTASRMVAEAGVLEAFGWPIARVLITEWWSEPSTVIDRLDHQLRQHR